MELKERNISRDLSILDFIYRTNTMFVPFSIWTPSKIGAKLQKNKLISRREFYRSDIWRGMVKAGVFTAQSDTYKYDRARLFDVLNDIVESDGILAKILRIKKRYSGYAPLIPPNMG